jgi:hypothetical protein
MAVKHIFSTREFNRLERAEPKCSRISDIRKLRQTLTRAQLSKFINKRKFK